MHDSAATSQVTGVPLQARLIIDRPQSGAWNMALDQALLECADTSRQVVLRFYQWSEPTLSLGYFQRLASRSEHQASQTSAIVRRASGGGAILHDRELTYSLVVPADARGTQLYDSRDTGALYRRVHESLIELLAELGATARLCAQASSEVRTDQPFLCFQRRAVGDVLLGDYKIAGSAQRRFRGTILQHGSILLRRSASAPELPGIADLSPFELSAEELTERWLPKLTRALELECQAGVVSAGETARAEELVRTRYGSSEWTALK